MQGGLQRFGKSLFEVFADSEAVDHHFDGVLLAQLEVRDFVDPVNGAVHAHPDIALGTQLIEQLGVFALAAAHHG